MKLIRVGKTHSADFKHRPARLYEVLTALLEQSDTELFEVDWRGYYVDSACCRNTIVSTVRKYGLPFMVFHQNERVFLVKIDD